MLSCYAFGDVFKCCFVLGAVCLYDLVKFVCLYSDDMLVALVLKCLVMFVAVFVLLLSYLLLCLLCICTVRLCLLLCVYTMSCHAC